MAVLAGLLSTQIANPFNWYRLIRGLVALLITSRKADDGNGESTKSRWDIFNDKFQCESDALISFWVMQVVTFLVIGGILWLWYFFGVPDRTFGQLFLGTGWLIGLGYFLNWVICGCLDYEGFYYPLQHFCYYIVVFLLSIGVLIHGGVYNFNNHVTAHTFVEAEVPVISIDVSSTLEKEVLIQGYTLKAPIYRGGTVIYPMSRTGNVSIAGYVKLTADGTPVIVRQDLHYTPYQSGSQNIKYVARDFLPTARFFGDWSFQIDENGRVYFAHIYGSFASVRGGRSVEGILLVDAETGRCNTYPINEVPNFVSGISE